MRFCIFNFLILILGLFYLFPGFVLRQLMGHILSFARRQPKDFFILFLYGKKFIKFSYNPSRWRSNWMQKYGTAVRQVPLGHEGEHVVDAQVVEHVGSARPTR